MHVNYIIRVSSAAAYVRPLLDRNNKNKKTPRTDAYRKPMDRNTVEYVIHIAYLYIIILYVQKRVQKYISPHIDVQLVKKSIEKLFE